MFAYAGNNPIKYTDPNGMWIDNGDGTYTAEEGDTLFALYGSEWKEKSGFTRDPRTLQVNEIVGKKKTPTNSDAPVEIKQQISQGNAQKSNQNVTSVDNGSFKTWWNKPEGATLTDKEADIQKNIAIGEMVVGPIAGSAASAIDPAAFLAGMYVMADGALVLSAAQDKVKKTPLVSIPSTFLLPYVKAGDLVLPAGGTFIW